MFTIQLQDVRLFGNHGVHEEEQVLGAEFVLQLQISFEAHAAINQLTDTINYVEVYDLVKKIFTVPQQLLETLAQQIVAAVYEMDKRIKNININICKINPPISNFIGKVCVNYSKSFN
jgi:7,8-dihydroneopterin aldolase/epimerase/oxygenase